MKRSILILFALSIFTGIANAQLVGAPTVPAAPMGGGFAGPSGFDTKPMTVKQALGLSDNARVVLRGHIVNSLGDEKYTFSDGTAEVVIEIDDEDWAGRQVTPETTIEIYGELDKEFFEQTKIDVDSFVVK